LKRKYEKDLRLSGASKNLEKYLGPSETSEVFEKSFKNI